MNRIFCWTLMVVLGCFFVPGCAPDVAEKPVAKSQADNKAAQAQAVPTDADGIRHVRPGDDIQLALEAAADDPVNKTIQVHAGTYRPQRHGQAMIWLNARHDGIQLEAVGEVILTAANPDIAGPNDKGYPAVVNHVVYFGDGISSNTTLKGFKITGANNFVTEVEDPVIEPNAEGINIVKGMYFYMDGGGIKIFGRSFPTIENIELYDNFASPCAGGISVEHQGIRGGTVTIRNCVFRNNECTVTGSAIDVLPGSSAFIENCLFVGNISNTGWDFVSPPDQKISFEHGSGALTVFRESWVSVDRCTFTGNWNGVDDNGHGSTYTESIFWMNNATGGAAPKGRYEFDIADGSGVVGCFVNGDTNDLRETIDPSKNTFDCPDPEFDDEFHPRAEGFENVGYRPEFNSVNIERDTRESGY